MGITAPVYADYITVYPEEIHGVGVSNGYTDLYTTKALKMCGTSNWTSARVNSTTGLHDRAVMLFTIAHATSQRLDLEVQCGSDNFLYATHVAIALP